VASFGYFAAVWRISRASQTVCVSGYMGKRDDYMEPGSIVRDREPADGR
jgi:hypothetical protein